MPDTSSNAVPMPPYMGDVQTLVEAAVRLAKATAIAAPVKPDAQAAGAKPMQISGLLLDQALQNMALADAGLLLLMSYSFNPVVLPRCNGDPPPTA